MVSLFHTIPLIDLDDFGVLFSFGTILNFRRGQLSFSYEGKYFIDVGIRNSCIQVVYQKVKNLYQNMVLYRSYPIIHTSRTSRVHIKELKTKGYSSGMSFSTASNPFLFLTFQITHIGARGITSSALGLLFFFLKS